MKRICFGRHFVIALAAFLMAAPAGSQEPSASKEKEKKVRKLMDLTGAGDLGKQVMTSLMDQFDKMGNLPEGFADKFNELADPKDLVEIVVPIYMKHLDEETIDAAIAFYESKAGKAFLKARPEIVKESMEAGQKWGTDLYQKVMKALEEE